MSQIASHILLLQDSLIFGSRSNKLWIILYRAETYTISDWSREATPLYANWRNAPLLYQYRHVSAVYFRFSLWCTRKDVHIHCWIRFYGPCIKWQGGIKCLLCSSFRHSVIPSIQSLSSQLLLHSCMDLIETGSNCCTTSLEVHEGRKFMIGKFWQSYGPWHLEFLHILAFHLNFSHIVWWIWMKLGRDAELHV